MAEAVHVKLVLEPTDPVRGRVRADGATGRPFHGWLDLLSGLEALCAEARQGNGAKEPGGKG
jgi:hypothetical protein